MAVELWESFAQIQRPRPSRLLVLLLGSRDSFSMEKFLAEILKFSLHSEASLLLRSLFSEGELMIRNCQHCGELILGEAYRVTSEEDGMPLLNMVVCSPCAIEAKKLQLHTELINPSVQHPSIQNGRSQRSRFRI